MVLTGNTKLADIQNLGATTLADIPLDELLAYVRNACLDVAKDMVAHPIDDAKLGWSAHYSNAALNVQGAIDAITTAVTGKIE